jgi:hypothetical protein
MTSDTGIYEEGPIIIQNPGNIKLKENIVLGEIESEEDPGSE